MADGDDAALLDPLTDEHLARHLLHRYLRGQIYTYVGAALVSVNPGRADGALYGAERAREYRARGPHQLAPHLYGVAAAAVRAVRHARDQCILITGEAGAGKTEAARVCLQCALVDARSPAAAALVAAGTLLEAFGNAATRRNHNASRFGKLLDVEFDRGEPVGGYITHYLLEKERASGARGGGERNFHVLHQLVAGADGGLLRALRLRRGHRYRLLRTERAAPAAAAADAEHWAHTRRAMAALRLDADPVMRLLAFLLKVGEADFEPRHEVDGSLGARLPDHGELRDACALLQLDADRLLDALGAAAELDARAGDPDWAGALRDRLVQSVYARLFSWLVAAANTQLRTPTRPAARATLAVLDAYGLEALEHNALDRLLINYCAERVQEAVTDATLRREQEEYVREGLRWRPLAVPETAAALLDEVLLPALDACSARRLPDTALLQRLQRHPHPRLSVCSPDRFRVVHFGAEVDYCARGMVADNRDEVPARLAAVLRGGGPLLAALFPAQGSPRRPRSLVARQRALLDALQRRLPAPRLVRCLRAAAAPPDRPRAPDLALLLRQIQDQGIGELARLRRRGWCESMPVAELVDRFSVLVRALPSDTSCAARALVRALPLPAGEFAFGRTRVFVRSPRTMWELEAWRAARVETLVRVVQRAWRERARRQKAARTISGWWWRRRRRLERSRRCAAVAVLERSWATAARRAYLRGTAVRLPARHESPLYAAWPPCPYPALLGATDALVRRLHHRWRCHRYRLAFDQTARNRMREKVTCSVLFLGRKATYARSVPHPFVGDYVRLRASAEWRRSASALDRVVVFADLVGKVSSAGRVSRALCVLSTSALLLLEPRALRARRRVPAGLVRRLSLSPLRDDLLAVHVAAAPEPAADCLAGGRARGDLLLRSVHVLELATKLFLVVQNASGAPPQVCVEPVFAVALGAQALQVAVHAPAAPLDLEPRLTRRANRLDVLL